MTGTGPNGSRGPGASPLVDADVVALHDGTLLVVHPAGRCLGPFCSIHNPSAHPLNTAPLMWNRALHLMFRICSHGTLHPDPDALGFLRLAAAFTAVPALTYDGWHPCCSSRCCQFEDGTGITNGPPIHGGNDGNDGIT